MADGKKEAKKEKVKSKGGPVKIIVLVFLLLVLLGGGFFAGYYFLIKKPQTTTANTKTATIAQTATSTNKTSTETASSETVKKVDVSAMSKHTLALDDFLVNLADEGGKRYMKVKIYLGYNSTTLTKEMNTKKPLIRDAIISVLRAKKSSDLTQAGVESLKKEIEEKINPLFDNGRVNNVYFYDIVIQ